MTVADGHGGSAVQTVTVTITGTNDAPTITAAIRRRGHRGRRRAGTGGEAGTETTAGAVTFTDVDLTDTHTAAVVAQASGYVGTFTLDIASAGPPATAPARVGWSFSVDDSAIDYLAAGQS